MTTSMPQACHTRTSGTTRTTCQRDYRPRARPSRVARLGLLLRLDNSSDL